MKTKSEVINKLRFRAGNGVKHARHGIGVIICEWSNKGESQFVKFDNSPSSMIIPTADLESCFARAEYRTSSRRHAMDHGMALAKQRKDAEKLKKKNAKART